MIFKDFYLASVTKNAEQLQQLFKKCFENSNLFVVTYIDVTDKSINEQHKVNEYVFSFNDGEVDTFTYHHSVYIVSFTYIVHRPLISLIF